MMKSSGKSNYAGTQLKPVELPLLLGQQPRVLFGMTGRQLLLLTCGLAASVSLWQQFASSEQSLSATILLGCCCAIPTALAGVIAFITLHTRPLEEWFFVLLAWLLTPDRLSSRKQILHTFLKVRAIQDDLAVLDLGDRGYEYQALLCVEGRDFNLMSEHEQAMMIEAFQQLLNGLSYAVTIHVRMRRYTPVPSSLVHIPQHLPKSLRRLYAHYLSFLLQLVAQKQPVRVAYFLTVPAGDLAEKDEVRRFEHAQRQVAHRIHEMNRQLARANLTTRRLHSYELLRFYQGFFSCEDVSKASAMPVDVTQLPGLLAPKSIAITATCLAIETAQTHDYLACLALTQLPRRAYPGWFHHLLATNEPYLDISMHIQPHESDLMTRHLRRKAVELGGALLAAHNQGERHGNTVTRHALRDVERVRDQLIRKDAHLYSITLLLLVHGRSRDDLQQRIKRIRLAMRSLDFQAAQLRFQHHLGYFSCLYGYNMVRRYAHLLPTEGAAAFYPFSHVPTMEGGVLLGATSNGNLVSLDPYHKKSVNANLAILGIPGSGKSFCFKVILARLAPTTKISILDLEGEYTRWAQAVGGQKVCLTSDAFHINPLELPKQTASHQNTLRERVAAVAGLCALLIGEHGRFTQSEKALILQSLLDTYAEHGITDDPTTHAASIPSMADFYATLKQQEASGDLCRRLAPYIHLFPPRTEPVFACQHAIYDLHQLSEDLRPAATYLIADRLWNELQASRQEAEQQEGTHVHHLVVIDEAWFLCKLEQGAALLSELARRIRKYAGGLWLGTQQIGDVLSLEQGKNLLSLCETKILFKQDISSIDAVKTTLHLNTAQAKLLQTARQGEALYLTGQDALAVEILASEQEAAMAQTLNNT